MMELVQLHKIDLTEITPGIGLVERLSEGIEWLDSPVLYLEKHYWIFSPPQKKVIFHNFSNINNDSVTVVCPACMWP